MLTETMAESNKPPNPHISGPDQDLSELARWAKVRALQAQAQIHATLAVKDHMPDSF